MYPVPVHIVELLPLPQPAVVPAEDLARRLAIAGLCEGLAFVISGYVKNDTALGVRRKHALVHVHFDS